MKVLIVGGGIGGPPPALSLHAAGIDCCIYEPVFSGLVEWRGALEAEPFLDGRTQVMIGHHDQRSVVYPISAKSQRRGRSLVNWLTLLAERDEDAERENWDRRVGK